MVDEIIEKLKGKKIAILGFGVEGKSTYNFIRRYLENTEVTVLCSEEDETEKNDILKKDEFVKFVIGKGYLDNLDKYDIILKAPGVSFKNINISKFENKITSQLELFLEYKKCLTIGITGTKGKSTTSTLIYDVLKEQEKDCYLLGNIGTPIFDKIEKIKPSSVVVLEISSHALQYIKKSTEIAILLNIYEEHLDHYKDFNEYIKAKLNILNYQEENGIAIFNSDSDNIRYKYKQSDYGITILGNKLTENTIELRQNEIYYNGVKIAIINEEEMNLKGKHNINNIMFVLAVSKIMNLDDIKTLETIKNFKPLEHRLEYVGTVNGVLYYNDSIATIPEATICSIKALKNVNTLIVGGKDRGVNLQNLIEFLKNSEISNVICMPTTGEYIAEGLKNSRKNVVKVSTMEEAVNKAKEFTEKEKICLLSPAAASYGFFKNFKERGEIFKRNVLK
jgi:UDP-N-acetylmuramoylalanine--D-glutamate ligase